MQLCLFRQMSVKLQKSAWFQAGSLHPENKKALENQGLLEKLEKRLELSTPSLREKKSEFFTIQYFAKSPVLWDLFVLFRLRFL